MVLQLWETAQQRQQKQTEAVNMLQSWLDAEDTAEQQETGTYLVQALDEDRLSDRPLFPRDRQGTTW